MHENGKILVHYLDLTKKFLIKRMSTLIGGIILRGKSVIRSDFMVTLKGIWLTLKTVKNPLNVARLYWDGKPRLVRFKNGFFEVTDRTSFLIFRRLILHGWKITRENGQRYLFYKNRMKIVSPLDKCGLFDKLEEFYRVFDFKDKVCLDVGGFIGETAVLFKLWGARKIIIYEPVAENCELIRLNTALNDVNAEIHCVGISDHDGTIEVKYDDFSVTFGLKGNKKMAIPTISVSKILTDEIDIAKVDCEGCERSLLSVPKETLRLIPNYVIEYHHHLGKKLMEKFIECGFNVEALTDTQKSVGIFKAWL